ncbi:MAG: hypothetical protein L3J26_06530 [Candidatus Polarisedimenticolaceae bacterium]|nr:hypothetical protein [Candidatus Polarisedimenticolaceae bacterium]
MDKKIYADFLVTKPDVFYLWRAPQAIISTGKGRSKPHLVGCLSNPKKGVYLEGSGLT